jgi:hypothetical protein
MQGSVKMARDLLHVVFFAFLPVPGIHVSHGTDFYIDSGIQPFFFRFSVVYFFSFTSSGLRTFPIPLLSTIYK